jgi:putative endonuclease
MSGSFFNSMASVYILLSRQLNRFYIGSCKDLEYRIQQHKMKEFDQSFTAKADDWSLFYHTDGLKSTQAKLIEQHIKRMKSKQYVQNLKDYPEIMERLKKKYA